MTQINNVCIAAAFLLMSVIPAQAAQSDVVSKIEQEQSGVSSGSNGQQYEWERNFNESTVLRSTLLNDGCPTYADEFAALFK